MGEAYQIAPLRGSPGIKRDGTNTEGSFWNAGTWTRFYQGLPRSIPGYRSMTSAYPAPSRGLFVNLNGTGYLDIFSGSANNLTVGEFTTGGFGSGVVDITPAAFASDPNNVWQLDSLYNPNGSGYTSILAHAAPNLTNISSSVAAPVYYGDITATVPLVAAKDDTGATFSVSGGVLSMPPYAVAYGSNGLVAYSQLNNVSVFPLAQQANPTATKIVKGMVVRGNAAPSCLLWSLDSLVQMTFVGGDTVFAYTTITDQSSILSSSAIVEMDGVYYWPGIDRFLVYGGTVRELPNETNGADFYKNINMVQRQKCFGFKIPAWGEIWWCYPSGTATECNRAIIYNVRENSWYDTPLPRDGRSAAFFAQSWQYPILAGANPISGTYQLWQHEFGSDEVIGSQVNAIYSAITSPQSCIVGGTLSSSSGAGAQPVETQLVAFEPDFIYGTALNINILGRTYAQDSDILLQQNTIVQGQNYFTTEIQARYLRWQIESNVQGGSFIMGTPLIAYREGDRNPG